MEFEHDDTLNYCAVRPPGQYLSFSDPVRVGSPLARAIISTSLKRIPSCEYLRDPSLKSTVLGLWNKFLQRALVSKGLLAKDAHRVYFGPNPDGTPRTLIWTPQRRSTATRSVAYPYYGKKTGRVAFWVHHACRLSFRQVGGTYFLNLVPSYVFTRDGTEFVDAADAGSLTTSRKSHERNYQVLNHLYFWTWFLADGGAEIVVPCGDEPILVTPTLASGRAGFGIGTDKKTLTSILGSDPDVDWAELESEQQEQEDE